MEKINKIDSNLIKFITIYLSINLINLLILIFQKMLIDGI